MPTVLGVGSALIDCLAHVPEAFLNTVPGRKGGTETVCAGDMQDLLRSLPVAPTRSPGGSAANTVAALARLGFRTRHLCRIGSDEPGMVYRRAMAEAGVDLQAFKESAELPTGTCLSLITPDSQRTMRTFLGASGDLGCADFRHRDLCGVTHVHAEGYLLESPPLTQHILETAFEAGCRISFDVNAPEIGERHRELLAELLKRYVDTVLVNHDEAVAVTGCQADEALRVLAGWCRTAVVKLGAEGALVRTKGVTWHIPAVSVHAVDTTGAGDCWAAGFIGGLLAGLDIDAAGRLGAILGAEVVQVTGAQLPPAGWKRVRREFCRLAEGQFDSRST